MTQVKSY